MNSDLTIPAVPMDAILTHNTPYAYHNWRDYTKKNNVNARVVSFIDAHKSMLFKIRPHIWIKVAKFLDMDIPDPAKTLVIEAMLGDELATKFLKETVDLAE